MLASWINREQQQRLDYLATEVAVLKEFMLRIDAGERRISCPKASPPGHSQLASVGQTARTKPICSGASVATPLQIGTEMPLGREAYFMPDGIFFDSTGTRRQILAPGH
jgi:hypothetical protein